MKLQIPPGARQIAEKLDKAGFETWAVGGAVRDGLRGVRSTDWDFATLARPAQIRRLFRKTIPLGIEHGTVGVLDPGGTMHEVTTFRKDVETDGRHAVVSFADRIEDDLARRDFTINAVAWHPLRNTLLDPHGGQADLEAGILRTVGEPADRFAEDYLRVLRALRFAGRFDLTVEAGTWAALVEAAPRLVRLSPERIREELIKVLGGAAPPSRALSLYRSSGAVAVVYPELEAVDPAVWAQALAAVDHLPHTDPWLRLAALLAPIGAPPPRPDEPSPETVSGLRTDDPVAARAVVRAVALLSRLRVSNRQLDQLSGWVGEAAGPPPLPSGAARRRWLARVGPGRLEGLVDLWTARHAVDPALPDPVPVSTALRKEVAADPPLAVGDLAVTGRDLIALGHRPGPWFGEVLEGLLDEVLERPERNTREALLPLLEKRAAEAAPGS